MRETEYGDQISSLKKRMHAPPEVEEEGSRETHKFTQLVSDGGELCPIGRHGHFDYPRIGGEFATAAPPHHRHWWIQGQKGADIQHYMLGHSLFLFGQPHQLGRVSVTRATAHTWNAHTRTLVLRTLLPANHTHTYIHTHTQRERERKQVHVKKAPPLGTRIISTCTRTVFSTATKSGLLVPLDKEEHKWKTGSACKRGGEGESGNEPQAQHV